MLLSYLEEWVLHIGGSELPPKDDCVPQALTGCWFLTPLRLATEGLCIAPLAFVLGALLTYRWVATPRKSHALPTWLRLLVILHYVVLVSYKLARPQNWAFLLMPCNITSGLWLLAAVVKSETVRALLFQHVVNLQGPTILIFSNGFCRALTGFGVAADTTGLNLPYEVKFFWFSHTLLAALGIYVVVTKRVVPWDGGFAMAVSTQLFGVSLYFGIVTVLSLYLNMNLNYMLHPPKHPQCPLGQFFASFNWFFDNYRLTYAAAICCVCLLARLMACILGWIVSWRWSDILDLKARIKQLTWRYVVIKLFSLGGLGGASGACRLCMLHIRTNYCHYFDAIVSVAGRHSQLCRENACVALHLLAPPLIFTIVLALMATAWSWLMYRFLAQNKLSRMRIFLLFGTWWLKLHFFALSQRPKGEWAIDLARRSKFKEVATSLEVYPCIWRARDAQRATILHYAAMAAPSDLVEHAIRQGAVLDAQDSNLQTPLMWALTRSINFETLQVLVKAGANLRHQDNKGYTPLIIAVQRKWPLAARFLFESEHGDLALLSDRDHNGFSAAHWAAFRGDLDSLEVLMELGADLRALDDRGMNTLHMAVYASHPSVVDFLLQKGLDPMEPTYANKTCYDIADLVKNQTAQHEATRTLLEDVRLQNKTTPTRSKEEL
eukprot:TRINITY_DN38397_c0_g1_i1.p1 TRINITY_DN38397_c0_g1~~TRINITY_DN38397_c0_g1_i1.p1  ORF type:complete len:663 (-),score=42.60 TRINITY_DN38397_c0_g1_i1:209-2197(-)